MSVVTFVLGELYIKSAGGEFLPAADMVKVVGIILLAVFSSSAMIVFLVSFFKSESAFSTASSIIGTLIGFLVGTYIPIGHLPEIAQRVIKIFPPSHAGMLIRRILMEKPMEVTFQHAPVEMTEQFKETMGVVLVNGENEVSIFLSIGLLVISGVVFYILGIWNMSRKNK
jgi:multidrug/hemolysin transport system permease protein